MFAEIDDAFKSYQFFRFFQTVQNFCVVDLSNFYLDIAKDRLYISAADSPRRRSCQTVLAICHLKIWRGRIRTCPFPTWRRISGKICPNATAEKICIPGGLGKARGSSGNGPICRPPGGQVRSIRQEVNKCWNRARTAKEIRLFSGGKGAACIFQTKDRDRSWR